MYDYTGKNVYVGIDVHKKTYVCVSVCEREVIKKDTMPSDPDGLIKYLKSRFTNATIETAHEAGFSGFHLHRELKAAGIKSNVVHAGSIEVASRDRVKTDKRDAQKLATQLAAGRLKCNYIPSIEQEACRTLSRLRRNVLKMKQQVGLKLKALLFTQGLIHGTDNSVLSKKWVHEKLEEIDRRAYPSELVFTIDWLAKKWLTLADELKDLHLKILKMQSDEDMELINLYKTAPGIGDTTALILKDELYDMQHFGNERQLFSYLGLTPSEFSSGEHVRQGHISRQGKPILRHALIEAAWVAIRKDQILRNTYFRISKTRGANRAIVAVARRLSGQLRSCLRKGEAYKITPVLT